MAASLTIYHASYKKTLSQADSPSVCQRVYAGSKEHSGKNADPKRNGLFGFYVFRRLALFHLDIVDQEAFLFINAEVVALVVDRF